MNRHDSMVTPARLLRVLTFSLLVVLLAGMAPPVRAQATAAGTDLRDPAGLARMIAEAPGEFRLIDVRTPGEFSQGHIPTAENIDYRLIAERMADGERDQLIVVYCRSGNRSARAARTLASMGYTNVVDFGGINRWNGPVERS